MMAGKGELLEAFEGLELFEGLEWFEFGCLQSFFHCAGSVTFVIPDYATDKPAKTLAVEPVDMEARDRYVIIILRWHGSAFAQHFILCSDCLLWH